MRAGFSSPSPAGSTGGPSDARPSSRLLGIWSANGIFVAPWAGVLVVCGDGVGYDSVREVRAARRFDAQPLTPELQQQMLEGFYYRYWRQKMDTERQRLFGERKAA